MDIETISSYLDDILPALGVNKKRELLRLLYEIAKRDGAEPSAILSAEKGLNFERAKKILLQKRYPLSFASAPKNAFYLPKLEPNPAQRADLTPREFYPKNIYQAHILYNIASVKGAEYAASNRDALEKSMKIDEILQAQAEAEAFKETPKELTTYIRKTFGNNIKSYIDDQMPKPAETPKTNLQNLRQQQLPPQPVVPQTPASPTNAAPRLV